MTSRGFPPLFGFPWEREREEPEPFRGRAATTYTCPTHFPPRERGKAVVAWTCEELASFRGMRSGVLKRTWVQVRELEGRGVPVSLEQFGQLMSQQWDKAKEVAATCPRGQAFAALA